MPASAVAPAVDVKSLLFDGVSAADQEEILADASIRSFAPREIIMHQGVRAERFFLMRSGCARFFLVTESGKKLPLLWAMPGDVVGGMGVVMHQRNYLLNCEAVRPTQIYVWRRDAIRKHLLRVPRLLDNGMHIASAYIDWLLNAYASVTCDSARDRLADVLTGYATAIGEPCKDGVLIDATNEEFAHAAHITKYTTCRLLAEWQKSGVIAKRRGKTILRDPGRLRRKSSG
ncbi:cyclic nucleotide-binding protein [Candidatus Koribacter versatilis Ellin345]|uniref:Cyclic nucleotide-binding protein n=1 Tax=Koribacter versatilis (strain Ellin345) TaxID=204669 RepID=Q1INW2_KORVE|nr:Crp/Fnr family transcriptional regulator [Candidatus Koribacter versatilis]ABF41438.1 cyclic nucleotide-binding protein [Candidatus Koribacter versatilis Ellin345]